jgi:hypothetical protein
MVQYFGDRNWVAVCCFRRTLSIDFVILTKLAFTDVLQSLQAKLNFDKRWIFCFLMLILISHEFTICDTDRQVAIDRILTEFHRHDAQIAHILHDRTAN